MVRRPKTETGYGVVGTWVLPKGRLGGSLPKYLSSNPTQAKLEGETNERLAEFSEDTEQWLCEITIKPVKRLSSEKVTREVMVDGLHFTSYAEKK